MKDAERMNMFLGMTAGKRLTSRADPKGARAVNEKPPRALEMTFHEALARLVRVPKPLVAQVDDNKKAGKAKTKPAVVDKKRQIAGK